MTLPPDEATLHAFIDGRLPPEQQADITAWLHAHPDEAARITAWKHDAHTLRTALAGAELPPNPNLSPARLRTRHREKRRARLALAASVVLALGLGGTLGWHGHALQSAPEVKPMSDALAAYRLFAEHELALEFTAAERASLYTWIQRHFGAAGTLPELDPQGWQLSGGRWLSTPEGAAVMLVYEDPQGERVGLYMRPRIPHVSATGERQDGELLAQYWLKDNIAFALVGPAAQSPVKRMAAALRGLPPFLEEAGKG